MEETLLSRMFDDQPKRSEPSSLSLTGLLSADMPRANSVAGLDNEAAVLGRVLPQIPGAIGETLVNDWKNDKLTMATKVGTAAAIGMGSAILLARSPQLAKGLLGLAGLSGGTYAVIGTGKFLGAAWSADTDLKRDQLVQGAHKTLGRIGADLVETTPGFLGGSYVGLKFSRMIPALDSTALAVRDHVNNPLKERISYMGRDAKTLPGVRGESGIDLLKVADDMAVRHPWKAVEEARFFKATSPESVKIGSTIVGTADEVMIGGRHNNIFHTHGSRITPTSGDFTAVNGTGVISIPERGLITFYNGVGTEAGLAEQLMVRGQTTLGREAAAKLSQQTFPSLVVDKSRGLAVRVDSTWVEKVGMQPKAVTVVEFEDALRVLRNWDGKRLNIESLTTPSPRMITRDGMTDLLRSLATGG